MAHPLDGIVTRPTSFQPEKDYALVVARGDNWLADYDVNDAQKILRQDQLVAFSTLFREGAVLREAGGTFGAPLAGVAIGQDSLLVLDPAGYLGAESQVYTLTLVTGGGPGVAQYTWVTTGNDTPDFEGERFPVTAIAGSVAAALADLATYGQAVGALGLRVAFINPGGTLTPTNSWMIEATYGSRPPVPDGDMLHCADVLVPVAGRMHRAAGTTLIFPPATSGVGVVYGEWTRTLVNNLDDPELTDPLSDTPCGWRERWSLRLLAHDPSESPLPAKVLERRVYALYYWDRATDVVRAVVEVPYAIDIQKTPGAITGLRLLNIDQNVTFQGTLARRTNAAHGSFVISPLPPTARAAKSSNPANPGKIRLSLPPLWVSVEGVEVTVDTPSEVEVDQTAGDLGTVPDEPHTYNTGQNTYTLNKALGGNPLPIEQVTKLTGQVQKGTVGQAGYERVTRGTGTDYDSLALSPVLTIVLISNSDGNANPNYTQGSDYEKSGDQIHWLSGPGAKRPPDGQAYYVVYQYRKLFTPTTEYTWSTSAVTFIGTILPVAGTLFEVDYRYYLARNDVLVVQPSGALQVIRGVPAEKPLPPTIPLYTLAYATIAIPPNSTAVTILPFDNDRTTMEELNSLKRLVRQIINNLARQDLLNQARAAATSANFINIWTEEFRTLDQADRTYNAGGVAFDATIDTGADTGELTLPFTQLLEALTRVPPQAVPEVRIGAAFYTLPYAPELAIDSPRWSRDWPVNPYADFRPEPPGMALTPDRDVWVDSLALTTTETRVVQNGRHESWAIVGGWIDSQTTLRDVPFLFMRQIDLRLDGGHFVPGEHVRLLFDGKLVPLTAQPPSTSVGDDFGVVARLSDPTHTYGDIAASFTIPALVPSGTVAVEVWGDRAVPGALWPDGYAVRARGTFSSTGTLRLETTQVTLTLVQNDPIAQSVVFDTPRMLCQFQVPMAAKPPDRSPPLVVELRATDRSGEASTPINAILGNWQREAVDVVVGPDTFDTPPTKNLYVLPDPVLCLANEFRALVLRSASNLYRAYVAEVGGSDRVSGGFIETQQIATGIFLDSSNNVDWTAHQGADLRCRVWVARMTAQTAYLYLSPIISTAMTAFFLLADQAVPEGTAIRWEYSIDGRVTWTACAPFTLTELPAVATTLEFRATFQSNSPYLSPALHKNLGVLVQKNKPATSFVSKSVTLTVDATKVPAQTGKTAFAGWIEYQEASGGSTQVFVSATDGATWWPMTKAIEGPVAGGFTRASLTVTGVPSGTQLRVRISQTTPNAAVRPRVQRIAVYATD
jgi:hypothetical protein